MVKKVIDPFQAVLERLYSGRNGGNPATWSPSHRNDINLSSDIATKIRERFANAQRRRVNKNFHKKPDDKTPRQVLIYGSGFLEPIINSIKYWGQYGKSWKNDSDKAKAELNRLRNLKKQRGGKFELADLRDGAMGPIGWIRMGIRKKRQKEINKLKKELGEK